MKFTKESSLVVPTLHILAINGPTKTSDLVQKLRTIMHQYPHDKKTVEGRTNTYFEQAVYNMISHKKLKGLADQVKVTGGTVLSITAKGQKYLQKQNKSN